MTNMMSMMMTRVSFLFRAMCAIRVVAHIEETRIQNTDWSYTCPFIIISPLQSRITIIISGILNFIFLTVYKTVYRWETLTK
jgi:hypothetical protein